MTIDLILKTINPNFWWNLSPSDINIGGNSQHYPYNWKTRGPLVLYRSPECWGYVKISGYWGNNRWAKKCLKLGIHMHVCVCVCVYVKYENPKINIEGTLMYRCVCVYAWYSNTLNSYATRRMTFSQTRMWIPSFSFENFQAVENNTGLPG